MNRRDTVITAVLVNAGLLVMLFGFGLKLEPADKMKKVHQKLSVSPEFGAQKLDNIPPAVAPVSSPEPLISTPLDHVEKQTSVNIEEWIEQNKKHHMQQNAPVPAETALPTEEKKEVISPEWEEIRVKQGDVLEKIARRYHVSVGEIVKSNNLSSTRLSIGQVLKIPKKREGENKKIEAVSALNVPAEKKVTEQFYTLKKGDSLWLVAQKNNVKVEDLLKLNSLDDKKARQLKPGDRIRIS